MPKDKQKLTLYGPATYKIKVLGILDEHWSDWNVGMAITVEYDEHNQPITTLTGTIDQAVLQGILHYSP